MKNTILPGLSVITRTLLLFSFSLVIYVPIHAQCFATSTLNGSSAVNDASIGSLGFSATNEALSSDDDHASATAIAALFNGSTNYLKVTGFGFNIPSYASVCGVVVEIEKRAGGLAVGAWIRDNDVRIVKANAVAGIDVGDDATDWSGTESTYVYGGTNDLWGTTLTPAEVNSPNFGIAISARMRGLAIVFPSAQIDNIRVRVYYNPILPVKVVAFAPSIRNNLVTLDWETADEAVGELISLQRTSSGSSNWVTLASYALRDEHTRKQYRFTDRLQHPGTYQYRLQITGQNHSISYSATRQVVYDSRPAPVLYPNPSADFINLDNLHDDSRISITNLAFQRFQPPVQYTGSNSARVDIRALASGLYYITSGSFRLKFYRE